MSETSAQIDTTDVKLLNLLQKDGKATQEWLADKVKLSASAVLRRVRRMEEAGIIKRYVAVVDAERMGLMLTAYLSVRLEKHNAQHKATPLELFKAAVQAWSEVTECAALTGEMDYLLRVQVRDMQHYSRFVLETLLKHPSVQDVKSSFVLAKIKG